MFVIFVDFVLLFDPLITSPTNQSLPITSFLTLFLSSDDLTPLYPLSYTGVASPPAMNGSSSHSSFDYHNPQVPYGCWFFRLAGSGIYVNVGRTLVVTQRWDSLTKSPQTTPFKSHTRFTPSQISHSNLSPKPQYKYPIQISHKLPRPVVCRPISDSLFPVTTQSLAASDQAIDCFVLWRWIRDMTLYRPCRLVLCCHTTTLLILF